MSTSINTPRRPQHDDPRVLLGLFGSIAFVILLVIASFFYRDVWPAVAYRPTPSVIDSVSIEEREGRRGTRYIPRVHFTYSVAGHTYHGTRVTPADLKGERAWADRLLAVYKPGATVPAYYDPDQPERAFLVRSIGDFVKYLAIGIVLIGLFNWRVAEAFRGERRLTSAEAIRTSIAMENVSVKDDRHDRVISITVASISLVLAVPPLIALGVNLVRSILYRRHGIPPVLLLLVAAGLVGIPVTIFRGLRRGKHFHWLSAGPLNYVLLLLMVVLGGIGVGEIKVFELLMVSRLGVRTEVANLLMLLPVIAGGLVFAFYWRRASAAGVPR